MLIVDDIRILIDVVIIDLTCASLVLHVVFSQGVAMMIVAQAKVVSYHDQHFE